MLMIILKIISYFSYRLAKYQNAIQICTEIAESINELHNEQHFGSTSSVANVSMQIQIYTYTRLLYLKYNYYTFYTS